MNRNKIPDPARLTDKELCALVGDITKALGASPERTAALTADPKRLRGMLGSMSERDIERLIERAGKEKAAEIYKALGRR
ncbi:MAG: hypothetical protein IKK83_04600 [Clostridia bacterium]|nr:hypothetical protein [Clostridia bacterium]